mmetsp:Transcript_151376/g.267193  ORF Transcript_151376/g.267193 Transcript_151376/m.267193 type:complete len:116 (+) Transcript_151376:85-432(+)
MRAIRLGLPAFILLASFWAQPLTLAERPTPSRGTSSYLSMYEQTEAAIVAGEAEDMSTAAGVGEATTPSTLAASWGGTLTQAARATEQGILGALHQDSLALAAATQSNLVFASPV